MLKGVLEDDEIQNEYVGPGGKESIIKNHLAFCCQTFCTCFFIFYYSIILQYYYDISYKKHNVFVMLVLQGLGHFKFILVLVGFFLLVFTSFFWFIELWSTYWERHSVSNTLNCSSTSKILLAKFVLLWRPY